ncbi:hypothetical protein PC120_g24762 [Phytophthora cactorum]|nr:hypothetical protein PC120_g24762 [Phytophthora cactorum]
MEKPKGAEETEEAEKAKITGSGHRGDGAGEGHQEVQGGEDNAESKLSTPTVRKTKQKKAAKKAAKKPAKLAGSLLAVKSKSSRGISACQVEDEKEEGKGSIQCISCEDQNVVGQ